jgi:hypothetical protein
MIGELEELIKTQNFDSAVEVIPTLKRIFHEQGEIDRTLDDLKKLLDEHSPHCQAKLMDLKHLVVG